MTLQPIPSEFPYFVFFFISAPSLAYGLSLTLFTLSFLISQSFIPFTWLVLNQLVFCSHTDKKEIIFSLSIRKFNWSSYKVIYEEELPNIWGNAQIFNPTYMRMPLVIYDFATALNWIPYMWGNFSFLFYQCTILPLDLAFCFFVTLHGMVTKINLEGCTPNILPSFVTYRM